MVKIKMKKNYTRKQLTEAIAYWTKVLKNMNEKQMIIYENSHKYNEQIQKIISNFKPKVKDVLGISINQIAYDDPEQIEDKISEKYLDFSDSRGTYYSEILNKVVPCSNNTYAGLKCLDLTGFSARFIDCSKRDVSRVPDRNPYDGWSPQYSNIKVVKDIIFKFKDGFKMLQLFDKTNDNKWIYTSGHKAGLISPFSNFQYGHKDKFLIYEAGPFIEKYLKEIKVIAFSDLNRLFETILSINGVKKQLDGNMYYNHVIPQRHTREYDNYLFKQTKTINRRKMKRKVGALNLKKEADLFFAKHPTLKQLLALENKIDSFAAAYFGYPNLKYMFEDELLNIDFDEDRVFDKIVKNMTQRMSENIADELCCQYDDDDEISKDMFKKIITNIKEYILDDIEEYIYQYRKNNCLYF